MTAWRSWTLARRPSGIPVPEDFEMRSVALPEVGNGLALIEVRIVSVDPGMRSRLGGDSYAEALKIGATIESAGIGRVVESHTPKLAAGDLVSLGSGWTSHVITDGRGVQKLDPALFAPPVGKTAAIGVLGIPGLTAWFGLHDLGRPKEGETLIVSSAAGPVGATAGQLGKSLGLTVIGIAGGAAKCAWLREVGFDAVIDYKAETDLDSAIAAAAPAGVDIVFDNVGGVTLDAMIGACRANARIVISGQVSEYNAVSPRGIRRVTDFITKRLTMSGLVVYDYRARFPQAVAAMAGMIRDGSLKHREEIIEGLDRAPEAFIGLFTGENFGRRLVKVAATE